MEALSGSLQSPESFRLSSKDSATGVGGCITVGARWGGTLDLEGEMLLLSAWLRRLPSGSPSAPGLIALATRCDSGASLISADALIRLNAGRHSAQAALV